jgi:hypothetical protein
MRLARRRAGGDSAGVASCATARSTPMPARGPVRPFAFLLALAVTASIVAGVDALATPDPFATQLVQGAPACVGG